MTRSKKIFVGLSIVFFFMLLYIIYDFGTRTTFPGSKAPLKETPKHPLPAQDSIPSDSTIKNRE